jgi:hypothetical protein
MDGGDVGDGRRLVVPGIPQFKFGEQVVVFVKDNGRTICPFVGWEQGLLRVDTDQKGQQLVKTSRGQRIHGVRNGAFLVGAGEKQSQKQDGVFIVDDNKGSAGVAESGQQTQELQTLSAAEAADDLSLAELRQEVRGQLVKAGYRKATAVRVKSAEIEFNSPAQGADAKRN